MSGVDERVLEEKLAALERARAWTPRLVSKLEALIRTQDEDKLFRVNPIAFASERGLSEQEAVDLFLHAAKLGLFHMEWQLICPICTDVAASYASVGDVGGRQFCHLCSTGVETSLDEYIAVAFTISSPIRSIRMHDPESLPIEDYCFRYHFSTLAFAEGGARMGESVAPLLRILRYVGAGESVRESVVLTPGALRLVDHTNRSAVTFMIGDATGIEQVVRVRMTTAGVEAAKTHLAAGRVEFDLENACGRRVALYAPNFPRDGVRPKIQFPRFLTGKRLFVSQTFRDLFGTETVRHEEGLALKDLTVLFSDLKGSTDMYDRIGDLKAFHLVQQHFDRLATVIRRHDGAIVKTIGDAVMATFATPVNAIAAALEMTTALEQFNHERGARELVLKLGVHRGPSIAVTLNGRLDYFGQVVNIAARVQALAEADEICVTEDVISDAATRALLAAYAVTASDVQLKGVARPVRVSRVRAQAA